MDEAVVRAKRRMRIGADPDYDLVYANFDVLHYLLQAPHLLDLPDVDLVEHFLENGLAKRLSPHPDFSMTEYIGRYPQQAESRRERSPYLTWLKHGKAAGEIADPAPRLGRAAHVLGLQQQEVAELLTERRRDLQQRFRTGRLGEMFARAAQIEPLIGATWTEIASPKLLPISRHPVVDEVFAIYRAHEAAGFRRARVVFVLGSAGGEGGRRMERHLAHALGAHLDHDEIVVIRTDDSTKAPVHTLPDGVRQIDFARIARHLPEEQAQHALVMLLRTFHADAVVHVDSAMLYRALRSYGRALAATERLFLCFFGNEQTAMGTWQGWSLRYFYRTFDYVAGVITDSEHLARELIDTYRVRARDRDRLHVLRAPVDPEIPVQSEPPTGPGRRPQVFWAGRRGEQRIGLVREVARRMPDVDFRTWGGRPLLADEGGSLPSNVSVDGRYRPIRELPLAEADVWLHSSTSDGVPSQLLEVAMTGIPIVGALVGGTGEVLGEQDSWPVRDAADPEAYVQAIRDVLADTGESRRRSSSLRERMLRERSEKQFATHAVDLLLSADAKEGAR
jgi:glycosyltransferase involved in cell wall biosynthesis